jgi:hypothetical protein
VYVVGLDILTLSELYGLLLNYSILLASVPIFFGIFLLLSKNVPKFLDYAINDANGYVSTNGNGKTQNQRLDFSLPFYLFFLGILLLFYNIILKILQPPIYISILVPILLFLIFLKQNNAKTQIYC